MSYSEYQFLCPKKAVAASSNVVLSSRWNTHIVSFEAITKDSKKCEPIMFCVYSIAGVMFSDDNNNLSKSRQRYKQNGCMSSRKCFVNHGKWIEC